MKYKIEASTRIYKKEEFKSYEQKCTLLKCVNQAVVKDGECDTMRDARVNLLHYRSSIMTDDCFVFVTEYILKSNSKFYNNMVAPLSEESWDVLCKLW